MELVLERTVAGLEANGIRVLTHSRVPPNDAGISLGQAAIAGARLGRMMRRKIPHQPSPSICAASSSSLGRFSKNDFMTSRLNTHNNVFGSFRRKSMDGKGI